MVTRESASSLRYSKDHEQEREQVYTTHGNNKHASGQPGYDQHASDMQADNLATTNMQADKLAKTTIAPSGNPNHIQLYSGTKAPDQVTSSCETEQADSQAETGTQAGRHRQASRQTQACMQSG